MADDIVTCPSCGTEIPVTKALRESIESKLMEGYNTKLEKEVQEKLVAERERIQERVRLDFDSKFEELNARVEAKEKYLLESQKRESEERKRRVELEEDLKEQEMLRERQMEEERTKMGEKIRKEYDEEFNLRNREIQQINEGLKKQVQELKQKLEQGSQQLQGEALEVEIEEQLRNTFPFDLIIPVPQGTKGPDLIQTVRNSSGLESGIIAWETKRTKEWNDGWIVKLKGDLVTYGAETGIIATKALPKGITSFGVKDGILVTNNENAIPLAIILRMNLMEVARQKRLGQNSLETREILYGYLTSTQFRQRVEAIAEGIIRMRSDIETEKRSMERQWAKRIKEIEKAISGISGMFGDLQGIIGSGLPSVKSLSFPEGNEDDSDSD